MQQIKRTKIVCTMGPSTEDEDVLRELIKSGMNVARFNFSHGSHEYHKAGMARVRKISDELGANVAILLDTKGPEVRTGLLEGGNKVTLETGQKVIVTTDDDVTGNAQRFSLDYKNLPNEVEKGSVILIDDGLIGLEVESVDGTDMSCVVTNGGDLGEKKGVNVPNVNIGLPAVTEQDIDDIVFGCTQGIDAIAASFIRDAAGVREIRKICADHGCPRVSIYPKIECAMGVKNFDEILDAASGIMVARGDLGVEVPAEEVPHLQKAMIRKCNEAYKPVITATQMLDSMIRNPRPTRAEVTDVANAVYDGTDCVMLSGETAAGKYPVEAVHTMAAVCVETEKYLEERTEYHDRGDLVKNVNGAIGFAAVTTAERVDAKCIVAPTTTGRTARLISNFRPSLPVVAVSESAVTVRKCSFYWGVTCLKADTRGTLSDVIYGSLKLAKSKGLADTGDMVVVTAGDPQTSPKQGDYVTSTNMVMVSQVQ
ncbi:MAG: pyruvate kinase [Atopobiaceae bacterium]|jgi:pyruvate kinase|nr:pyruvate kinase [Atopobiaceae bacterium]MCH4180176.1 pyruvate kinase [Atopobiaceae bacterium]MCH4214346.1 pyruvate kinase [Atopobiaceae bacterium]MCH4229223.1 pyruvate kinase [Atopobiaceae bacterium]MCH4276594.1 pyruvate kinase [Atopobiaceae bacterium]